MKIISIGDLVTDFYYKVVFNFMTDNIKSMV